MKRPIALLLIFAVCVTLVLPFATLSAGAEAAAQSTTPEVGDVLWQQTFDTTASGNDAVLSAMNATSDPYGLAAWSLLANNSSNTSALTISDGALQVSTEYKQYGILTRTADVELQLFGGDAMNAFARDNDYTLSFDLTMTAGSATNYTAVRFNRKDDSNRIETLLRLNGSGYVKAKHAGTEYSLEDDGLKANTAEAAAGTTSTGHKTMALNVTYGEATLLTLLNGTDSSISASYSSSATALLNKKLSVRIESIHGAGIIVAINGVVVSTTIKNVYYYDKLHEECGAVSLFFPAGVKATLDNLALTAGGSYSITTDDLGLRVMDVNVLFSRSSDYSMHWIVGEDENGNPILRMDALLTVIGQHDPDIIGMQERTFNLVTGGSENTIVDSLVAMGYGVIENKLIQNSPNWYGNASIYDSYNPELIFYKTEKFILMNDSNREDEYIKGGKLKGTVTNDRVAHGVTLFDQAINESYRSLFDRDSDTVNVPVIIGDQPYDTTLYRTVQVRYIGKMLAGENNPQREAMELHYIPAYGTDYRPVTKTDAEVAGWLDVTTFDDAAMANVTYDAASGKVVYGGDSYDGAYYSRYQPSEVIAVLLTGKSASEARYNPDSNSYRLFYSGCHSSVTDSFFGVGSGKTSAVFPMGYPAKLVTELRTKGSAYDHTDYNPVTLTVARQQEMTGENPSYLNVTDFTQAEYDQIVMKGDGTTACTYQGIEYKGMYYVRSALDSGVGNTDTKGFTWGVLKLRSTGQLMLVMNTHGALSMGNDWLSDGRYNWMDLSTMRVAGAKQITDTYEKVVAKYGEMPTILTGDFNMQNSDAMYAALSAYFDDTARLAPGVIYWEYTHHSPDSVLEYTGEKDADGYPIIYYNKGEITHLTYPNPAYPIDHIFVTPDDFEVERYNVLNDSRLELLMTDHCAIVVDVVFKSVFKPTCSHKSGVYKGTQTVTLTPAMTDDVIYYTTDGSDPTDAANPARKTYTGALTISGDAALKAVSCRGGVYSPVRTVNFSTCADIAITEIICNPKGVNNNGYDIQEGFEIVNVSGHAIDLADYTFWCDTSTDKSALQDGKILHRYSMGHLRVQEADTYIMQPGETFFMWTVMNDSYISKLSYSANADPEYAVEFVTEAKLNDPATVARWAELGYTGLTSESIGKVIYRKDLIARYYNENTNSSIDASHIVPLERTSSGGIYGADAPEGSMRKDVDGTKTATTGLDAGFNMGNSVFSRMFITYSDALTAENAFTTAYLDDDHGASAGIYYEGTTPKVREGTFTMQPQLDTTTGIVTSYATAFNSIGSEFLTIGTLNTATDNAAQKQDVSLFVEFMTGDALRVLVNTGDESTALDLYVARGDTVALPTKAAAGTGVFFGWESSTGKLYAPGVDVTVTEEVSFEPFYLVFATIPGASMRTTSGSVGIRFSTAVDKAGYERLVTLLGGKDKLQMGTYIVPEAYVTRAGGFDVDKFPMHLNVKAGAFRTEDATSYTMAGSIANIYEKNYRLSYAACGYFAFTYADGSAGHIYAGFPEDGARTVVGVAAMAYNDRSVRTDAKYKYYCATENNYSPYTENQRKVMLPFLTDVCCISFEYDFSGEKEAYDISLTGNSVGIEAACSYDASGDAILVIRTDGVAWDIADVLVNGEETAFAVDGNRLIVYLDQYTPEY